MKASHDELHFLGEEFLTWLWYRIERDGGEFQIDDETIGVSMDDFIVFSPRTDDDTEQTLRKGLPTRSAEARAALRNGRRVRKAKLVLAQGEQQWSLVVDGPTLNALSVKLPPDDEEASTPQAKAADRIANFLAIDHLLRGLYRCYLQDRLRTDYLKTGGEQQAQWMAGGS